MSQTSVGVDFTLETMQYKFATIIGELCGKPSILSQFAVWLDLRLAEYKLKGSISLDCSGQKPEPDWLHGLKERAALSTDIHVNHYSQSQANLQRQHSENTPISSFPLSHSSALHAHEQQYPHLEGETSQLPDPDIKHQFNYSSQDEVIPLGFHPNLSHKSRQHPSKYLGKRQSRSEESGHHSPPKHSKSSFNLDSDDASVNEPNPLNSSYTCRQTPETSKADFTSPISTNSPSMEGTHNSIYQRADNSGIQDQEYSDKKDSGLDTDFLKSLGEAAEQSSADADVKDLPERFFVPVESLEERANVTEVLRVLDSNLHAEPHTSSESQSYQQTSQVDPLSDPNTPTRRGRLDTMARVYGCARNTVSNVYASVMCFERWFKSLTDQPNSERKMFEIPPQELDQLLVDFFNSIKKPDGGDYNPNSLRSLRTNLARYLKENSYQHPIVTSELFFKSQLAFKRRMHDLLEKTIRWS